VFITPVCYGRRLHALLVGLLTLVAATFAVLALSPVAHAASAKSAPPSAKSALPSAKACIKPKTTAGRKACAKRKKALAASAKPGSKKSRKPNTKPAVVKAPVIVKAPTTTPATTPVATAPATPASTPSTPATPSTTSDSAISTTTTRLYSASSPFNTKIPTTPRIASNSSAMVNASLLNYKSSANFANSDDWGISIVNARSSDPQRSVGVFNWGYGGDISAPAVRIPDGAAPTKGSDHHLVVLDGDRELDMWVAEQQTGGSWLAGARAVSSATGNGIAGPISGNAAGFALAAGVIRPEEIKAGRVDHALVFTSPYVRNTFVAPAVHGDGRQSDPNAMPMGTRIQLDPAVDISGLARPQRIMAQALKDYGAYLVDSSGSLAIRGEASVGRASTGGPSDIWSPAGVTDTGLSAIPWSKMRVIAS